MADFRRFRLHSAACLAAAALAGLAAPAAAAPPVSRGEQFLALTGPACMQRADQVFRALGWSSTVQGSSLVLGLKGIHSSYITCNDLGNGYSLVNVFVASDQGVPEVPGTERVILQQAMAGQLAANPAPPNCHGLGVVKVGDGTVQLSWTGATMDGDDWYTIVPAGSPQDAYTNWDRPNQATGTRIWSGLGAGNWEYRYFLDNRLIPAASCPFSLP